MRASLPPKRWLAAAASVVVGLAAFRPVQRHLRAALFLRNFAAASPQLSVEVMDETVRTSRGPVRARRYSPPRAGDAPGLVLIHGVHHLGLDEPRLVRFARTLADAGFVVLTPEVQELADYRVEPASIDVIGDSAVALANQLHTGKVGVMGLSFAGGLSLLAAADPRYAARVGYVVAIGAHDDLGRVSRFFATNRIDAPDGTPLPLAAHEYGPLVLVYANAQDFFPPADLAGAREALKSWLWERRDEARKKAETLSEPTRATLTRLFDGHREELRSELLAVIAKNTGPMAAVSPHGHLARLRAPVLLLHGAGDNVIPPTETEWLEREVPPSLLDDALVTGALQHVELRGTPTLRDDWQLIHFLSRLFALSRSQQAALVDPGSSG